MFPSITETLFCPFPREVMAKPAEQGYDDDIIGRWKVNNLKQAERFVNSNNGRYDCCFAIYSYPHFILDRISLDLDGSYAISEGQQIYKWCIEHKLSTIPVISGKKGIWLHILLKEEFYDKPKQILTRATLGLVREALGEDSKSLDRSKVGDVRGMSRVPNTLRPPDNINWCSYLPQDFHKMTESEVAYYSKSPYVPNGEYFPIKREKTLFDLPQAEITVSNGNGSMFFLSSRGEFASNIDVTNPHKFLQRLLRPCLYRSITSKKPPNVVRVAVVADLLRLSFSEQEIYSALSRLEWDNFSSNITRYHIHRLSEMGNDLPSYSCSRLSAEGIEHKERCIVR